MPEKRGCHFPNEQSLQLFEEYSFSNCILECYINITKASPQTQCVPWYLPRSNGSTLPSCDPWKTIQFRKEMSKIEPSQCSHCLSDCDSVKYFVTSSSNKFKYVLILLFYTLPIPLHGEKYRVAVLLKSILGHVTQPILTRLHFVTF